MPHINIKPLERSRVYETPEQAIQHLWLYGVSIQKDWQGIVFGRHIALIRRYNEATKAKDYGAFIAQKRRGFWRIELSDAT